MKAMVYQGDNVLTYPEAPIPNLKKDEVRLRVKACGVCGSDVHAYLGKTGRRTPPMIMGHEICVEIVAVEKADSHLKKRR